ncbi:MAG: hypothetical protein Q8L34_05785 [Candidatus Woesearchaeota archaeon]|nr:hypothetical protein [Candidatus Woesearchaeota archaeon]
MHKKSLTIAIIAGIILIVFISSCANQNLKTENLDGKQQGVFGTVWKHEYGCGQPLPDGRDCGDVNEKVGEGEKITVDVADQIDSYGNVNSQHTIATYYTDKKGTYKADLKPGNYIICAWDRYCSSIITVETDKLTEVNLSIDLPRP